MKNTKAFFLKPPTKQYIHRSFAELQAAVKVLKKVEPGYLPPWERELYETAMFIGGKFADMEKRRAKEAELKKAIDDYFDNRFGNHKDGAATRGEIVEGVLKLNPKFTEQMVRLAIRRLAPGRGKYIDSQVVKV